MPSIAISANPDQLAVSDADKAEMQAVRLKRRIFELISKVRTVISCQHFDHGCNFGVHLSSFRGC